MLCKSHWNNLPQTDEVHTLQPGGEEGAPAESAAAAGSQQGRQPGVGGEHLMDERGPVPALPQD